VHPCIGMSAQEDIPFDLVVHSQSVQNLSSFGSEADWVPRLLEEYLRHHALVFMAQ